MTHKEELVKLSMNDMRVLDLCTSVEMKCADLYRQLEIIHADFPEIALLWRKTAIEEDNHAAQFKLASRLKGAGMEGVKVNTEKVTFILQSIESYMDKIKNSHPSPTEALSFAIHLEDTLSEFHMSTAVAFNDPELPKLFHAMMGNDIGHVTMLKDTLAKMTKE